MDIPANLREMDVYKEGVLVGIFFILSTILLYILNLFFEVEWLLTFALIFLAIGVVSLFMSLFIPFIGRKKGNMILFIWNEILVLFIGIPLASICILILPVSIVLLFFRPDVATVGLFCLSFVLALQFSYLIYTGVKLWLDNRSSGYLVPTKADKALIEKLLYKISFRKD